MTRAAGSCSSTAATSCANDAAVGNIIVSIIVVTVLEGIIRAVVRSDISGASTATTCAGVEDDASGGSIIFVIVDIPDIPLVCAQSIPE